MEHTCLQFNIFIQKNNSINKCCVLAKLCNIPDIAFKLYEYDMHDIYWIKQTF